MKQILVPDGTWSVFDGLAAEHLLSERPADNGPACIFWQGPAALVMGKNQNPWREVNLREVRAEGIPLARRISGGGTVYHDPGNLNLSWVIPRDQYRAELITGLFFDALQELGLEGTPGVNGGIRLKGKKVSGAAFCYRKDYVLHHGTLLLSADLPRMRRLLSPPRLHVDTHAVRSVPAAVANLTDFIPGLTLEELHALFTRHTEQVFGPLEPVTQLGDPQELRSASDSFQSAAWLWDQTPAFSVTIEDGTGSSFSFKVRKGIASSWSVDGTGRTDIPELPFRNQSIPLWAEALRISAAQLETALQDTGWQLPEPDG